jgi:hypothetical protein
MMHGSTSMGGMSDVATFDTYIAGGFCSCIAGWRRGRAHPDPFEGQYNDTR